MGLLSTPLDTALGSTSKVRVMRLLVEQDRTVSAREASRLTRMSLPAVRAAIESLVKAGLVHREISGRQFLCRANREHLLVIHIFAPLFASEAKWPVLLFGEIRDMIENTEKAAKVFASQTQFDLIAAWIFGSVAKGTDRPGSDFDLMFLARNEHTANVIANEVANELPSLSRRLGTDVRPVIVTLAQAKRQLQHHDPFMIGALRSARLVLGELPTELRIGKTNERKASR